MAFKKLSPEYISTVELNTYRHVIVDHINEIETGLQSLQQLKMFDKTSIFDYEGREKFLNAKRNQAIDLFNHCQEEMKRRMESKLGHNFEFDKISEKLVQIQDKVKEMSNRKVN